MDIQNDQAIANEEKIHLSSDDDNVALEMTPSSLEEETDTPEELILTPSLPDEQIENDDLVLEAESIYKAEEITFEGEEESMRRIEEAMSAYDKAMDQAAGIKKTDK